MNNTSVRVHVLNGEWPLIFQHWYPEMKQAETETQTLDAA
jgi:hypothetical protein